MIVMTASADPKIHAAAIRIAQRCRRIIQTVLREEEWVDADREFYLVAREELEQLDRLRNSNDQNSHKQERLA
jgi:hypothetical protein